MDIPFSAAHIPVRNTSLENQPCGGFFEKVPEEEALNVQLAQSPRCLLRVNGTWYARTVLWDSKPLISSINQLMGAVWYLHTDIAQHCPFKSVTGCAVKIANEFVVFHIYSSMLLVLLVYMGHPGRVRLTTPCCQRVRRLWD